MRGRSLRRIRAGLLVVALALPLPASSAALAAQRETSGRGAKPAPHDSRAPAQRAAMAQERSGGRRGDEMSARGQATASSRRQFGQARADEMSARDEAKASDEKGEAGGRAAGEAGGESAGEERFTSGAPGNNGTVKVDGVVFDDGRANEPHPGCTFRLKFFGYDEAPDLFATATFALHAPTGDETLTTDRIFIGDGDSASSIYDLSSALMGVPSHPQQGHHIKLTVRAPYSHGAEVKHKVFWVDCSPSGTGSQAQALAAKQLREDRAASVLGFRMTAPYHGGSHNSHHSHSHNSHHSHELAARRPSSARLPFTGASLAALVTAALALVSGGALALKARKR